MKLRNRQRWHRRYFKGFLFLRIPCVNTMKYELIYPLFLHLAPYPVTLPPVNFLSFFMTQCFPYVPGRWTIHRNMGKLPAATSPPPKKILSTANSFSKGWHLGLSTSSIMDLGITWSHTGLVLKTTAAVSSWWPYPRPVSRTECYIPHSHLLVLMSSCLIFYNVPWALVVMGLI